MTRIACLLLLAIGLGCSGASAPETEAEAPAAEEIHRYDLRGKVVELRPGETNAAVIDHEEIVGFMDAMTMTFPVKDEAEFDKLLVDAVITAEVVSGDDEFYIENIEVVEAAAPAESH